MENGRNRLQQAQEEVEEVRVIMLDNMNKASERESKLGELDDRAEELLNKSIVFQKTTQKVKEKKRWDSIKMKVLLTGIGIIVVAVIVGLIINSIVGAASESKEAAAVASASENDTAGK